MKNRRNIFSYILYMTVLVIVCTSMHANAFTLPYAPGFSYGTNNAFAAANTGISRLSKITMYMPDGRTTLVRKNQVAAFEKAGWHTEPVRIMYAADGRTLVIKTAETEAYENVGWYQEPVRIMYAADGRTLVIKTAETEAYENVGWYQEPVRIMYAADGRTLVIKTAETAAYENVGWYQEPPILVYAEDGRTLHIIPSELDAYLAVGWYKSPADFPNKGAMVALTFDDGPSKYTNRILDCLEKYNAKATFFVVGNSVSAYPSALKRAHSAGMEIGNHTMTHPNLKSLSASSARDNINNATAKIVSVTGAKPTLLRPPYGNYNDTVSSVAGMPLILWSVDTLDWKTRDADSTVNCVLKEVKDGSVVLMHDLYEATASAVERIVPALIQRGYRLVTVSELAKSKGYQLTNGKAYRSFR